MKVVLLRRYDLILPFGWYFSLVLYAQFFADIFKYVEKVLILMSAIMIILYERK